MFKNNIQIQRNQSFYSSVNIIWSLVAITADNQGVNVTKHKLSVNISAKIMLPNDPILLMSYCGIKEKLLVSCVHECDKF